MLMLLQAVPLLRRSVVITFKLMFLRPQLVSGRNKMVAKLIVGDDSKFCEGTIMPVFFKVFSLCVTKLIGFIKQ
jgi:hypothetical protein